MDGAGADGCVVAPGKGVLPATVKEPPPPEYGFGLTDGTRAGAGAGAGAGVVVVGVGFVPMTGAGPMGAM